MNLYQLVQVFYDTTSVTHEDEQEALNVIFECSDFILHRQDFAKQHITQDDAENIALSNESFISDYFEHNELPEELINSIIAEHSTKLANSLAISEPAAATELLNELFYWRKQGRI